MDPETTFSDEEVRRILRRAAEREEDARSAELPSARSLTLRDIEEIGRNVGIAPEYIAGAAHELTRARDAPPARTRFGIPTAITASRHLDRTPTDAEWESMVRAFRRIFRVNGVASHFGTVREWSSTAGSGDEAPLTIALRPSAEGAGLTARQDAGIYAQLPAALGGGIAGTGVAIGVVMGLLGRFGTTGLGAVLWLVGAGGLAFTVSLFGLRVWSRRQRKRIRDALDEASRLVGPGA